MPVLTGEEKGVFKARVYDLNEKSAKQILFGMVDILEKRPSVKTVEFIELVGDGIKLTDYESSGKGV